jgi:hypothetical protein
VPTDCSGSGRRRRVRVQIEARSGSRRKFDRKARPKGAKCALFTYRCCSSRSI